MDKVVWKPTANGVFSFRSATKELQGILDTPEPFWKKVWSGLSPPKIEFFLWQLLRGSVKVRKFLLDRGIVNVDNEKCGFCISEVESSFHLFFGCTFSWSLWMRICKSWGISWVLPGDIKGAFLSWFDNRVDTNCQVVWRLLFSACIWSIWLSRNLVVFEGKNPNDIPVFDLIFIRLVNWFQAKFPESTNSGWEAQQNPKLLITPIKSKYVGSSCWTRPRRGWMKFNVDAAVRTDLGIAGIGGILRDDEGRTRAVFSKVISVQDVETAEFVAMMEATRMFDQHYNNGCYDGVIIETDSLIANHWFADMSKLPWRLFTQGKELEVLKQRLPGMEVSKIPRAMNVLADNLAKAGLGRTNPLSITL